MGGGELLSSVLTTGAGCGCGFAFASTVVFGGGSDGGLMASAVGGCAAWIAGGGGSGRGCAGDGKGLGELVARSVFAGGSTRTRRGVPLVAAGLGGGVVAMAGTEVTKGAWMCRRGQVLFQLASDRCDGLRVWRRGLQGQVAAVLFAARTGRRAGIAPKRWRGLIAPGESQAVFPAHC